MITFPSSISYLKKGALFASVAFFAAHAEAQMLSTPNIFSGTTATASSEYNSSLAAANLVDGTANPWASAQYSQDFTINFTGFNSGIDQINFYDATQYQGLTPKSVTIYYSNTTTQSLTESDYTTLGTFALPVKPTNSDSYLLPTTYGSGKSYDTLTGLSIPSGTKSILFQLPSSAASGQVGYAFTEIQGFAVPEPSTWTMGGLLALIGFWKIRRSTSTSTR